MAQHSLTLWLSDLFRDLPFDDRWPTMPALQRLVTRGTRQSVPTDGYRRLLELFNLPVAVGIELPLGPLSAYGDNIDVSGGWWFCVEPVHLVADRDQLYLSGSEVLGVSQGEADALVAELNHLYAQDGWQFLAAAPQRWYLRLPQALSICTIPTATAMGRRLGEVLPQGDDALYWQRVMTEIQMLLHATEVNTQRTETGRLTINSLWFWGGGELPAAADANTWGRVVTEDALVRGLARLHGIETSGHLPDLQELPGEKGRILWHTTAESLEQAEQEIFAPLLGMLQSGQLGSVAIELSGLGHWYIDRPALRRWWRRGKPIASLLRPEE